MQKQRCYMYTRVSTAMQVEGFSLDAQKEKLRKYAEFQDLFIAGEYTDEGKSGKNIDGRPEFQRMLEDIESGKDNISYVLVYKLSRFGRNAADSLNALQRMEDYGVNLICVEEGIDSSKDSGKLMISVLSAVAEIERENILVQTMEGRKQKAREGKWNGGFAPYGYRLENGELKIAEDEAEMIRLIYDKFIHTNMGAATIARYMSQHGYVKKNVKTGHLIPSLPILLNWCWTTLYTAENWPTGAEKARRYPEPGISIILLSNQNIRFMRAHMKQLSVKRIGFWLRQNARKQA